MAAGRKAGWTLEDLIDFEVAVARSPSVDPGVARQIREDLKGRDLATVDSRRRGLREWLRAQGRGSGARVQSATRFMGLLLLVLTFLLGVAVVRGMVIRVEGRSALNIWIFLAGTIGVQWLILLLGLAGYLLARYWIGGLGWLQELLSGAVRKWAGRVSPEAWRSLVQGKGRQPSALAWRFTRVLQLGGVGFNLGLLLGLFGVLWFTEVAFFWESSLSQFGGESLGQVTRVLAMPWGGSGLSPDEVDGLRRLDGGTGERPWQAFFDFIFVALLVWGLLPRLLLWGGAVWRERQVLAGLAFQDPGHRKLWREISRVERVVAMEGMQDGVVLLEVGGLEVDHEALRPFLLQRLRVNPEEVFEVGVLDQEREKEAWAAMRGAPCGVVVLVEDWNLSPKEMTSLLGRIRREAGEATVLRLLVMGDGMITPDRADFARWSDFVDSLRDPRLECVAYES